MNISRALLHAAAACAIKPCHAAGDNKTLPQPAVFLVRHNDLRGPLNAFVSLKPPPRLWVLDVFFHFPDCFHQYRDYTFSARQGKRPQRFPIKALAAAGVVPPLIRSIKSIPVHRSKREILKTFEATNKVLIDGESIVIAANVDYSNTQNPIKEIYTGFFHLEKAYFRDTGRHLAFIPLIFNEKERVMTFSKPLYFSGEKPFFTEKKELTTAVITFLNQN